MIYLITSLRDGKSCISFFFKIDFRGSSSRDQISGDMGIWIKYTLRTRENNTYFLFKVFYAPSTKYEFNVVVVQLVLSKYICSIFHEPPTFATNRKQVSKANRWMKEKKMVFHIIRTYQRNEIEVNVAIFKVNYT